MLSTFRELLNATRGRPGPPGTPGAEEEGRGAEHRAGARLLSHYRAHWQAMHVANEENVQQAAQLAQQVAVLERGVALERRNADLVAHLLADSVRPMVKACASQMEQLLDGFKAAEAALLALEDAAEERELEGARRANLARLREHEGRRRDRLGALRGRLEARHRVVVEEREALDRRQREERRLVFQEAFRSDLEQYRILGAVPRAAVAPADRAPSALLEEIQLDQDTSELDSFLDGDGS